MIGASQMQSKKAMKKWSLLIWTICLLVSIAGCQAPSRDSAETPAPSLSVPAAANPAPQSQPDQAAPTRPSMPGDEAEKPAPTAAPAQATKETASPKVIVYRGQSYSTRDEVAAYINQYHVLPPNYITKSEAQKLGWDSSKGNLWQVSSQKSIGGDRFGNLEGLLPKAAGRQYYECDINYQGGFRGAERIVYSTDGLIFYTADHYKTFRKLY